MALTREKAVDFVRKLRLQAESEEKLDNFGAAELFTEKANDLITKYDLNESELEVVVTSTFKIVNELGKSIVPNPFNRANAKTNLHQEWFSLLAEEVGRNYKCKTAPRVQTGEVSFYGYDLDREMAIFMFLRLADVANTIAKKELPIAKKNVGRKATKDLGTGEVVTFPEIWFGDDRFFESFHFGFRNSLKELHEKQQNGVICPEVIEYFNQNKNSDGYYHPNDEANFYRSNQAVPQYIKIGEKAGRIAFKKSTSSTAIISKKAEKALTNDSVVLAIDTSGSMYGSNLEQAKQGAIDFAKTSIEKGYKVGLVSFDDDARAIIAPDTNIAKFRSSTTELISKGWTNMEAGIRCAISYFNSRQGKKTICIVTDGAPDSEEKALSAANDAKRLGIEIMCIGTDGANLEFLEKLQSREGLALLVDRTQLQLTMGEMAGKLR